MTLGILLVICTLNLLLDVLILVLFSSKTKVNDKPDKLPGVSILIAVRNEEENIRKCLQTVLNQNYPGEKIEVLIGDDQSTDRTLAVSKEFEKSDKRVKVFEVGNEMENTKAKAGILDFLAKKANSEYFLITDADIRTPPTWIKQMVEYMVPKTGLISSITTVRGTKIWDRLQNLDWLAAQGHIKILYNLNIPVTAIGNNMMITREAYFSSQGFSKTRNFLTEDMALLKNVIVKNYKPYFLINPETCVKTESASSLSDLIHQRTRWMMGAFHSPPVIIILWFFRFLYFPAVIALFFFLPVLPFLILLIRWLSHYEFIRMVGERIQIKSAIWEVIIFDFYYFFINLISIIHYILPLKVKWKERKY